MSGYAATMTQREDAASAAPRAEDLEHLGQEIDAVRRRLAEEMGERGPHFIDEGTESEHEPVDNSIAPPG